MTVRQMFVTGKNIFIFFTCFFLLRSPFVPVSAAFLCTVETNPFIHHFYPKNILNGRKEYLDSVQQAEGSLRPLNVYIYSLSGRIADLAMSICSPLSISVTKEARAHNPNFTILIVIARK